MAEKSNGLVFPTVDELVHPAPRDGVVLFDVEARTDLAVETLQSMGMVNDEGLARETVGHGIAALHETLVGDGYTDGNELEVFQAVELPPESHAGFAFRSLIAAYENMQAAEVYRYFKLWDLYTSAEVNRRNFNPTPSRRSDGEALVSTPMAMQRRTDYAGEAGLQFLNKRRREQMGAAKDAIANSSTRQTQAWIMNPADYVMLSAQRRVEGVPLLDMSRTRTRFIQMDEKFADSTSMIPSAGTPDGELRFVGTKGSERGSEGARILMGLRREA